MLYNWSHVGDCRWFLTSNSKFWYLIEERLDSYIEAGKFLIVILNLSLTNLAPLPPSCDENCVDNSDVSIPRVGSGNKPLGRVGSGSCIVYDVCQA